MKKDDKLHDSSNKKVSNKCKKDSPDKNKLDNTKDKSGDDDMELIREKSTKKNTFEAMLDKISSELPVAKEKDGMIILDKNNPDDVEWWNDED